MNRGVGLNSVPSQPLPAPLGRTNQEFRDLQLDSFPCFWVGKLRPRQVKGLPAYESSLPPAFRSVPGMAKLLLLHIPYQRFGVR